MLRSLREVQKLLVEEMGIRDAHRDLVAAKLKCLDTATTSQTRVVWLHSLIGILALITVSVGFSAKTATAFLSQASDLISPLFSSAPSSSRSSDAAARRLKSMIMHS